MSWGTTPAVTAIATKVLLLALYNKSLCVRELAEVTGYSEATISKWCKLFHKRDKENLNLIYVDSYVKHAVKGPYSPVYAFGIGEPDRAVSPGTRPSSFYNSEWRKKNARNRNITCDRGTEGRIIHCAGD